MTELGNKLQALREERGLKQSELANLLGVTTPAIYHLERGIRVPSFKMLVKLADAFGISTDELARMSTEEKPEPEIA